MLLLSGLSPPASRLVWGWFVATVISWLMVSDLAGRRVRCPAQLLLGGTSPILDGAGGLVGGRAAARLSDLDGRQASFFYVVAGLVAVLGVLLALVLGLAARSAATEEAVDRGVATGVLVVECLASGAAWVLLVAGWHGPEVLVGALLLPVLVLAARSCWPANGADPSPSATTGP